MLHNLYHNKIIRYIFFGGLTTLVNLLSYTFFRFVFHLNINISNIISIILAIIFAYIVNSKYVFESVCKSYKEKIIEFNKFVGARIFTMIIEVLGVYIMTSLLLLNDLFSKILIQFIVLVLNYIFSKIIVFKKVS
jgi:putative flippase GtrA